MKNLEDYNIY